jgi:hypothetical protein
MPSAPRPSHPRHRSPDPAPRRPPDRSPLDGTSRLIVDGTNLLYRLGSGAAAPPAAAIGRLRAVIPAAVDIDLVFDGIGHGVAGRVAQGMYVRFAGRRTGDDVILDLVSEAVMAAGSGPAAGASVLVVTNDRELRALLAVKGARTVPLQWLLGRLDMPFLSSASPGNKRPPIGLGSGPGAPGGRGGPGAPGGLGSGPGAPGGRGGAGGPDDDDRAGRPGWKPGRGATTKTGPAHRVARHKRHPRHGD